MGDNAASTFFGWYASSRENGDLSGMDQNNIVPAAAEYFNITSQADHSELSCFPPRPELPRHRRLRCQSASRRAHLRLIQLHPALLLHPVRRRQRRGLAVVEKLDLLARIFVRTHEDEGDQILYIILDVFSLVFGLSLSGVYNKVLTSLPYIKETQGREDNLACAQASASQMSTSAIAIARDAGQATLIQLKDNAQLGSDLSSVYNQTSGSSATPGSISSSAMTCRAFWV